MGSDIGGSSPLGRIVRHKAFLTIVVLAALVGIFIFSSQFTDRAPVVASISPEIGFPGNVLVIRGKHFGDSRQGGEVTIAGVRPTSSSYLEWTNERIGVRIPDSVGSGLVFVRNRTGKSEGHLFTNRNHIPVIVSGSRIAPGFPYIESIDPEGGPVGTLVTIRGFNFGFSQGSGKVYFTPVTLADTPLSFEPDQLGAFLSASEADFDYESWTDQEIRVRIPDGAATGNIKILNDRGLSNAAFLDVEAVVGTKMFGEKRGYQIQYGMNLMDITADGPYELDIWMPGVYANLVQRDVESVYDPEPFGNDERGVDRYNIRNVFKPQIPVTETEGAAPSAALTIINLMTWMERYEIQTRINPANVERVYDTGRRLYRAYTRPNEIVSITEKSSSVAASLTRSTKSPYYMAKALYDFIVTKVDLDPSVMENDPDRILEEGTADILGFAALFVSLCRSVGIPARTVGGILVYDDKIVENFYWAEFYLEDFGWVPVDPVLGSGARFGDIPLVPNPREYYFGNLDNHRISFSYGLLDVKPIAPNGSIRRLDRFFSLQTIHEEINGPVSSYVTQWLPVKVVEWW